MWLDGQADLMLLGVGSVQLKSLPTRGLNEKPGVVALSSSLLG